MRTLILSLTAILIFGGLVQTYAQTEETVSVGLGKRKTADRGRLSVVFLSVVEDSRCPMNARCVGAGNAKIKISVSKGRGKVQTIELNTGTEPLTVTALGYKFELQDLKPHKGDPHAGRKTIATISITRVK